MSLASRLQEPPKTVVGNKCHVGIILETVDGEELKALVAALDLNSGWGHAPLSRALKAEGHHASASSVQRHRVGDCRCDDPR